MQNARDRATPKLKQTCGIHICLREFMKKDIFYPSDQTFAKFFSVHFGAGPSQNSQMVDEREIKT